MTVNKRIRSRLMALAYLILITILFLLPGSALPKENWFDAIYLDKWIHVALFALLIFLWLIALPVLSGRARFAVLVFAVFYGFLIELSQELFIANRSMDVFDIVADAVGVLAGSLLWNAYKKNKPL